MTYLLDTNVLSETRKRQPAVGVAEWIAATPPDRMHISVLTLGEIERGIARSRGRGDQDQTAALERWLQDLQAGFEERILPVSLPVVDALITATARVHGLTVVTRNVKDFEPAGIPVLNPFTG